MQQQSDWLLLLRIQCNSNLIGCCFAYINRARSVASVLAEMERDMERDVVVSSSLLKAIENLPSCDDSAFNIGALELLGGPPSAKRRS